MFINKKKLFILLVIFITAIFTFMLYFTGSVPFKPTKSSKIPARREFPVNTKINPCVNFYEYACSPVISSFKLREDRSRHQFAISDSSERLLDYKKRYFVNLAKKKPESKMEEEIKDYYLACMNKEARKKEEIEFVDKTKARLAKIKTKEEFLDMLARNIKSASQLSFIGFDTVANLDRPEYDDLFFDVGLRSLPEKSYYENKKLTKDLKILMEDFFATIGESSPKKRAQWVFDFEKALSQVYPVPHEFMERIYSRTKVSRRDLIKRYPYLRLQGFLSEIPKHVVIRNIIGHETLDFLNKRLKQLSLEELKSIYLYFQLVPIMDDACPNFFDKRFAFNRNYLGGSKKRSKRKERCTRTVMGAFNKETDFILLPKLFPNFPKEKFIKSIEKIRTSLIEQLENNDWLTPKAKREAVRKIKKAKLGLVSPNNEEEWDFNPLGDYRTDTPIANSFKLGKLLLEKQLKELEGPVNTNRWFMGPLTVNAYYTKSYNQFVFPIGILQYPFYDPNEPEEINLAAIGQIIGHELGHAIDSRGDRFDADGKLRPWMSAKDKEIFNKRSEYLVKQFNRIGHNGKLTLAENIADLVGLATAYHAAFSDDKEASKELKRRFFLQYARTWCEVEREGVIKMRLKTDSHSLGSARVNEQMKHQKGFKDAYNCKPVDSLVIPEGEMIKIW